jgi:hypothetical protein
LRQIPQQFFNFPFSCRTSYHYRINPSYKVKRAP